MVYESISFPCGTMEMSPEVCADVVMWFVDNVVGIRNAAGDAYIEMCSSVSSLISDKK